MARSEDVVVRSGVVHVRGSCGELSLLVEAIDLFGLGVTSVGLLLNLIDGFRVPGCMLSCSEGHV